MLNRSPAQALMCALIGGCLREDVGSSLKALGSLLLGVVDFWDGMAWLSSVCYLAFTAFHSTGDSVALQSYIAQRKSCAWKEQKHFQPTNAGLYVPTSDIDLVITDSKAPNIQYALKTLATALTKTGVAHKMQVMSERFLGRYPGGGAFCCSTAAVGFAT